METESKLSRAPGSIVDPTAAAGSSSAAAGAVHRVTFAWGLFTVRATRSTALLLLAMIMGAVGGYVHAATSFVSYIGNRQFKASWGWWYALRTTIGAALALMIYLAFRAGLLTTSGSGADAQIDPYGVAAVSALAGLFSKQATDKLEEIFNTASGGTWREHFRVKVRYQRRSGFELVATGCIACFMRRAEELRCCVTRALSVRHLHR